ncbi:diguanylate cyclase (GGDEF)-like protein [Rheinheimera pacifica]|uniref:tetratricopeptide repeat-containing diguanylate cyclase n=1 Tax=Rheinheimera pacifica TaxID=173990 RepID=UPI002169904A|nr:GGDEF domain-containing protein [Rheinheimera pacifica]MCS4306595.1 diguanylate cyclase (GGDEF)-like protein [Rheinheimera pacifica]
MKTKVSCKQFYQLISWILALMIFTVLATEQRFSEFEQRVFNVVMAPQLSAEERWQELVQLKNEPESELPGNKALLLMQQCRLAYRHNFGDQAGILQQSAALQQLAGYQQGAAAYVKCQQYEATALDHTERIFERGYQAYHALNNTDVTLMHMWLAYDYANEALEAGYTDEGIEAINRSLNIAQYNQLPEWEGESLGVLAVLQSVLKLYDEALETSSQALAIITSPLIERNLLLNRGYILTQAKKFDDAIALYQTLLQSTEGQDRRLFLMAGANMSGIYNEQNKLDENLALTEKLVAEAELEGDDYLWSHAAMARAYALLEAGDKDAARSLFSRSKVWFENNDVLMPLSESLVNWAHLLYRKGLYQDAYDALLESKLLKTQTDEARRTQDALLSNAVLATEQQRRTLLLVQQAHERDRALLTQKQLEQRLWLIVIIATIMLSAAIFYAYYRLRHAHSLLEEKNQQLDYESNHDPLTKVFNRRYFNQFMRSKLVASNDALLLLMDIDFFKKVNDTYGHHAGDQVLQIVSKRLASRLRNGDCIVRWGGEEFLLYIDRPADINNCQILIQRLLAEVEGSPIKLDDAELKVTVSIGFAYVQLTTQAELEQQLMQIDSFLYQAKQQGRNRAVGLFSGDTKAQLPTVITSSPAPA